MRRTATGRDSTGSGSRRSIPHCVRFLDNVIDMNRYPIPEIDDATQATRKIGLGVMGWHDALMQLRIPYDSEEALALAKRSRASSRRRPTTHRWSWRESAARSRRGRGRATTPDSPYRNATRTTVAPTGTISIIADCSSGIEPVFALAFKRQHYLDPNDPVEADAAARSQPVLPRRRRTKAASTARS